MPDALWNWLVVQSPSVVLLITLLIGGAKSSPWWGFTAQHDKLISRYAAHIAALEAQLAAAAVRERDLRRLALSRAGQDDAPGDSGAA